MAQAPGYWRSLTDAGSRGEIVRPTARAMAVATGKILAIEPDSDAVDVRKLDTDDLFSRFETLHRIDYTTSSMAVYRAAVPQGSRHVPGLARQATRLEECRPHDG